MIKNTVLRNVTLALALSLSSASLAAPAAACGGYSFRPDPSVRVQNAALEFAARRFPRLVSPHIAEVEVDGDRASAVVRGERHAYRLELRRIDADWRVATWTRHTAA